MTETTTTTSLQDQRARLAEKLTARKLLGAEHIVGKLPDLDGAERTVDYFDDQPGRKGPGLLLHLLKSGEAGQYSRPAAEVDRRTVLMAELEAEGLTARELPFALAAVLVRGRAPVATLRAHLRRTAPWLYDDGPDAP